MRKAPLAPTATRTSSPGAKAALLRSGAGKHEDRRTRRNRSRSAQRGSALRDQAVSW